MSLQVSSFQPAQTLSPYSTEIVEEPSFVSFLGFANKPAPKSGANLAFRRSTLRITPSASNPISAQVDGSGTVITDALKYASPAWLPPE
jgi:hypothetical protein